MARIHSIGISLVMREGDAEIANSLTQCDDRTAFPCQACMAEGNKRNVTIWENNLQKA
jgi:hypothetical protein